MNLRHWNCPSCGLYHDFHTEYLTKWGGRVQCVRCHTAGQIPGFGSGTPSQLSTSSAEAEYQAALQEHNQIQRDLQAARNADSLNMLNWGSPLGAAMNLLTKTSIADGERKLEQARQRLQAAEARRTR